MNITRVQQHVFVHTLSLDSDSKTHTHTKNTKEQPTKQTNKDIKFICMIKQPLSLV